MFTSRSKPFSRWRKPHAPRSTAHAIHGVRAFFFLVVELPHASGPERTRRGNGLEIRQGFGAVPSPAFGHAARRATLSGEDRAWRLAARSGSGPWAADRQWRIGSWF